MLKIENINYINKQSIPSYLSENMRFYGLNPNSIKDKKTYADLLEKMKIFEPKELRGTKKDHVTGYYWSRKDDFIAKNKYNIPLSLVSLVLSVEASENCKCLVNINYNNSQFSVFLLNLNNTTDLICVSVCNKEYDKKRILKAMPVKSIYIYNKKINDYVKNNFVF